MSTRTADSSSHAGHAGRPSWRSEHIIDHQLARTRRRLKLVDLGVLLAALLGGIILYAMGLVLVDHWVLGLSVTARVVALGILVVGVGYYCARWLFPVIARPINPCYAARAIEQSDASLKNSVINFLMCRRESTPTGRLVYRALQQRAAQDLRQVNLDLAIDQSRLIRVGYIVVTLMALFAAYMIFSPKDVFQTVQRVSVPWADLPRPTRVTIDDVQPGDTAVIRGGRTRVSARVFGTGNDDTIRLLYTTKDRQTVDRAVEMEPPETGQYYTALLPPDEQGIQQDVTYRVQAGDASSPVFQLTMRHVPSIVVKEIEYRYPAYMDRAPRRCRGEAEIRGVEGTTVTVHARANHPIKQASVEFDPQGESAAGTHAMDCEGKQASFTFPLVWDDAGNVAEYTAYRLAFTPKLETEPGARGAAEKTARRRSAEHGIQVTPDLSPEISILTPEQKTLELPANGRQRIEVRALDPDYGLTHVSLHAEVGEAECLNKTFSEAESGQIGQVVVEYVFRPQKLNLQSGDRVTLWAEAKDNCQEPNVAKTREKIVNIIEPESDGQKAKNDEDAREKGPEESSSDQQNASEPAPSDSDGQSAAGGPDQSSGQSQGENSSDASSDRQRTGQEGGGDANKAAPDEKTDGGSQGESRQESTGQPQPAQQGAQTEGNQAGQGGQQSSGAAGEESGDQGGGNQRGTGGSSGQSGDAQEGTGGESGNSPARAKQSGQSGATSSDAGSSEDSGADASGQAGNGESGSEGGSGQQAGASPAKGGAGRSSQTKQNSRPSHDGEAFERLLEYLKDQSSPAGGKKGTEGPDQSQGASGDSSAEHDNRAGKKASPEGPTPDAQSDGPGAGEGQAPREAGGNNSRRAMRETGQPEAGQPDSATASESSSQEGEGGGSEASSDSDGEASSRQSARGAREEQQSQHDGGSDSMSSTERKKSTGHQGHPAANRASSEQQEGRSGAEAGSEERAGQDGRESSGDGAAESSRREGASPESAGGGTDRGAGGESGSKSSSESGQAEGRSAEGDDPNEGRSAEPGQSGSDESGASSTANEPGDTHPSSAEAAKSGKESSRDGPRQTERQKTQSKSAADKTPPNGKGSPSAQPSGKRDRQKGGKRGRTGTASGNSGGGGLADDATVVPGKSPRKVAGADEANMEYAREATDLVLEQLKDEQRDPDPELLESLGWSPKELREFVTRWETMKRNARQQGGQAQRELRDALRSLGLRADQPQRRDTQAKDDALRGMREDGARSRPPAEVLEQFNAYKKGMARGTR